MMETLTKVGQIVVIVGAKEKSLNGDFVVKSIKTPAFDSERSTHWMQPIIMDLNARKKK